VWEEAKKKKALRGKRAGWSHFIAIRCPPPNGFWGKEPTVEQRKYNFGTKGDGAEIPMIGNRLQEVKKQYKLGGGEKACDPKQKSARWKTGGFGKMTRDNPSKKKVKNGGGT